MNKTIWKLQNVIKNYDWGTTEALATLFNIPNPNNQHQAEVWMGAHLGGSSIVDNSNGQAESLFALIERDRNGILGQKTAERYHTLPYLFKILSAQSPLSVQVHPELEKAKLGFEKENQLGIPLDSPKRNYKDPNHKPELVYAITPFMAMNGFRPITEIVVLFQRLNIDLLIHQVEQLLQSPTPQQLKRFFKHILIADGNNKRQLIQQLLIALENLTQFPFSLIKDMAKKYPDDCGLFAPLFLNVIELQPGQAMFLKAQTPHAYIRGTGLEIMASSDNVLRAGLTSKHIDVEELLDNTRFDSLSMSQLLTTPVHEKNRTLFPVPVNDFKFEILKSTKSITTEIVNSAEILLCIEGFVTISTKTESIAITAGESVFIAYEAKNFSYQGMGLLARAYN